MCGIAGVVGEAGLKDVRWPDLSHRGPDGRGDWQDGNVRLRHWRLRIVDLTAASDQPFVAADGSAVLVYNGEIYNAADVRADLVKAGAVFRTRGDTEVVLQALTMWGRAGIARLRGMFAFAAWLRGPRRLVLARDGFGVKPLFYAAKADGIRFASELPALITLLDRRPAPNLGALWDFFTFGFVPAPATAFEGIHKLLPGQILEFDAMGRILSDTRLTPPWVARGPSHRSAGAQGSQGPQGPQGPAGPEGSALAIKEALVSSVREQFEADVPVGVFLSGGVDSNVLLAAAAEAGLTRVKTFTVAFEDALEGDANDETAAARESARYFGTEHTEIPVRLGQPEELLQDLERFGEPFANPTVYLTRLMSRETARSVKVALSGAGGDELFGGYPRYAALSRHLLLRGPMGRTAGALARMVPAVAGRRTPRAIRRVAWAAGSGLPGADRAYLEWTYYLREDEKSRLLPGLSGGRLDSLTRMAPWFSTLSGPDVPVATAPACDLAMFLPENILAYTDVGSMAESLEVRVPFLDPDLAYSALQGLTQQDLSFRRPKASLRRLFANQLPPHVRQARKRGFNPPLAPWLRGPLGDLLSSAETAAFRRDFVNEPELHRMRALHRDGVEDFSQELLSVLVAGTWYERWR